MQDGRYKKVLDRVEEMTGAIGIQEALNVAIAADVVGCKEELDRNLMGYLKIFTSGDAQKLVVKLGKDRVYEAYRQLCESGRSRRPEHVAAMRARVQAAQSCVPLTGLLSAIIDWEKDLEYVEKVHTSLGKAFNMDEEDRRLHIVNMCPKDFGEYLLRETERFPTYAKVRAEIVEHIARSRRPGKGLHALDEMIPKEVQSGTQFFRGAARGARRGRAVVHFVPGRPRRGAPEECDGDREEHEAEGQRQGQRQEQGCREGRRRREGPRSCRPKGASGRVLQLWRRPLRPRLPDAQCRATRQGQRQRWKERRAAYLAIPGAVAKLVSVPEQGGLADLVSAQGQRQGQRVRERDRRTSRAAR